MFVPVLPFIGPYGTASLAIGGSVVTAKYFCNKKRKLDDFHEIPVITSCLEPTFANRTTLADKNVTHAKQQLEAVENDIRKLEEETSKKMNILLEKKKVCIDTLEVHEKSAKKVKLLQDAIHETVAKHKSLYDAKSGKEDDVPSGPSGTKSTSTKRKKA